MIDNIELFNIYFSPGYGTVIPINFEYRNGTKFVRYFDDFTSYWKISISSENRLKKSNDNRNELTPFRIFSLKDEI